MLSSHVAQQVHKCRVIFRYAAGDVHVHGTAWRARTAIVSVRKFLIHKSSSGSQFEHRISGTNLHGTLFQIAVGAPGMLPFALDLMFQAGAYTMRRAKRQYRVPSSPWSKLQYVRVTSHGDQTSRNHASCAARCRGSSVPSERGTDHPRPKRLSLMWRMGQLCANPERLQLYDIYTIEVGKIDLSRYLLTRRRNQRWRRIVGPPTTCRF